jgi:hypothetical protein
MKRTNKIICSDDYEYIQEQLLEDQDVNINSERIEILKYIYEKYTKIFLEAYKNVIMV